MRSSVLDGYRAVCWLSPADGRDRAGRGDPAAALLEDEDCGRLADALAPLGSVLTPALGRSLRILLPRLGRPFPSGDIAVPRGAAVRLRPLLLRHVAATALRADRRTRTGAETPGTFFPGRETLLALLGILAAEGGLAARPATEAASPPASPAVGTAEGRTVKAVAFCLPQFHPIAENDRRWGRGFTEWANVVRGRPLFRHHYQPRLPADLDFYDLRLPETQEAQAALARRFGIHGFRYHHHWFNGRKLLNRPVERMLRSGRPDLPFRFCWANEKRSRNRDGQNRHILLEQSYATESNRAFIREIMPMMQDPRYIRHHGRPVLVVHRDSMIPDWPEKVRMWREECRRAGLGEIHLCAVRFGLEPLDGPPESHGVTPLRFRARMASILDREDRHNPDGGSRVIINARNEWAEGTTPEPDQRWGTGYLEAFRSAAARRALPAPAARDAPRDAPPPAEIAPPAPDAEPEIRRLSRNARRGPGRAPAGDRRRVGRAARAGAAGRERLLAPCRDVAAVADAVVALADDPAEVARMGEAGRASVAEGFHETLTPRGRHVFSVPTYGACFDECLGPLSADEAERRFGQFDHVRRFSPHDVTRTPGALFRIPDAYDLPALVDAAALRDADAPEAAWRGYSGNSAFCLARDDLIA